MLYVFTGNLSVSVISLAAVVQYYDLNKIIIFHS